MRAMLAASLVMAMGAAAIAQPLPEGIGLAGRYPGDEGIGADPAVLFAEDFEAESLREVTERWTDAPDEAGGVLALSDEAAPGGGRRGLRVTATLGRNTGGYLYKVLEPGVERAFARFYVRFPDPASYIHHFVHFGGYHPPTPWPQGGAGERPEGDDRVTVGIEPFGHNGRAAPPGDWNFYTYWHEMKQSADGRYWGNGLRPAHSRAAPAGRWQCVEMMIKLNSAPEARDGELALWLDGELAAHFRRGARRGPWTGLGFELAEAGGEPFEGFNFRTDEDLNINFFWLLHYVTETSQRRNRVSDPPRVNRVWFDQVVVARRYIGPIRPK